jgi:hypothetical protein
MLRSGSDLESPELGGVPLNTELHVRERLRLADGTMRIHVCRSANQSTARVTITTVSCCCLASKQATILRSAATCVSTGSEYHNRVKQHGAPPVYNLMCY